MTELGRLMFDINEDVRERLGAIHLLTNEAAEPSETPALEVRIQIQHADEVLEAVATSRLARPPREA
jgi:hypothetical protein